MKKLILLLVLGITSISYSQISEKDNFLGGSIGFWATGDVPLFGLNFESHVSQAGIGTIGVGGLFRYYTYNNVYLNGDSRRYTFSSLGAQVNYNFNQIGSGVFVPYIGLVLGYNHVNSTYYDYTRRGVYVTDISYNSGTWLWGQLGMRYFFSNRVAGTLRAGFGNRDFNTLELGVDFKL